MADDDESAVFGQRTVLSKQSCTQVRGVRLGTASPEVASVEHPLMGTLGSGIEPLYEHVERADGECLSIRYT